MSSPSQHIEQHISEQLQQRLSPLQVRFVRLLEMNSSEAEEAVEKELADNPALERVEEEPAQNLTEEGEVFGETAEDLQRKDYSDPDEIPYYRLRTPDSGHREEERPQVTPDYGDDLYSSLLAQLGELPISQETRELAEYIVGNLDPNGYLQRTPAGMVSDIAVATGREVSTEQMRRALQAVQSLDPPGVGASSLEESIRLQLERLQPSQRRDDALRIVAEAWDSFLKKHAHRITSRLKISPERTEAAMSLIASLNPKPGGAVGTSRITRSAPILPDFIVDADENGNLTISLGGRRSELAIQASFESAVKMMQQDAGKKKVRGSEYITARYNDARDFIALMKQRRDTLLSVITAIVKLQKQYFLTGDDSTLRPMTLRDVAALTGRDPSTISRATSGKYVQTRAGIVPLRHFFSEGFSGGGGGDVSARQVQAALKALVEKEDPKHPLSDDALCKLLAGKGFEVSRRTVAKYRDRLGIPVARLRKS